VLDAGTPDSKRFYCYPPLEDQCRNWRKGSEAASKCHATPETLTVKEFQKKFRNFAKTFRKTAIYGQVSRRKRHEKPILS
jgi:hypothetical protein